MKVDTQRGESAARRGILVNTEPGAQSTYSVELDGDTCRSKVEKLAAALREETESYARRGLTSIKKMEIFCLVIRYMTVKSTELAMRLN